MRRKSYKLFSRVNGLFALGLSLLSSVGNAQAVFTFSYTAGQQTVSLAPGNYSFQCWGADGGLGNINSGSVPNAQIAGGVAGYSSRTITITSPTTLNIVVGGRGADGFLNATAPGGYNGGGNGSTASTHRGGGGGGASHIATATGILSSLSGNQAAVLIVGGGGGGGGNQSIGGHGGGLNGVQPASATQFSNRVAGGGGSQTTGGVCFTSGSGAVFGQGGTSTQNLAGGGGGGWYGGCTGDNSTGGGGGSGYTGGVPSSSTIVFGTAGYIANPDVNANGRVVITSLCNITISSSAPNSLNPSICSGQSLTLTTNAVSNYTWSSGNTTATSIVVSPTASTTYSVIGTSTANCQAANNISVIVSTGLPVLSISNPSNNVCSGRAVALTATGALTYTWNLGVQNGQPFTPVNTATYIVTGQNGCGTSTAATAVTVAPMSVLVTANPASLCQGSAATLTAVSPVNGYTWAPANITGNNAIVGPMVNTVYTVTASDGTCTNTQTVAINILQTPTLTLTPSITYVCAGQVATFSVSGVGVGGSYNWLSGSGSGATFTLAPASNSLVSVIGTNTLNCGATAQAAVVVSQPAPLSVVANKTLICQGSEAVLSASGSNSYQWSGGPSTAAYSVSPSAASTVYTVTGSNTSNSCTATGTVAVAVITPSVNYTSSLTICEGGSATLTATGANTYTWGAVNTQSTGVLVVAPVISTNYVLIANTQSLATICTSTYAAIVQVNQNPTLTIAASKTTAICRGNSVILTAGGAQTYTWSNNATTGSISVSPSVTTTYSVIVTSSLDCSSTQQRVVLVSSCTGLEEMNLSKSLVVFPNPSSGYFTIRSDYDMSIQVLSVLGEVIREIDLTSQNNFNLNLTDLPAGLYFLKENNTSNSAVRIVIEK